MRDVWRMQRQDRRALQNADNQRLRKAEHQAQAERIMPRARSGQTAPRWIGCPADVARLTFFRSAATCLHSPAARPEGSRKTRRGSAGPTDGTWSAAAKSWAAVGASLQT